MSSTKIITTQEVASKLVSFMQSGQVQEAQQELFAENVSSIEPPHLPVKSAHGKDAVIKKGAEFAAMIEERHGGSFSDALVSGRFFSCAMTLDATFKGMGRMNLEEIIIYEVEDGKIVSEQFFA
ncbi:MAG: nuclear transport factor 2 family protein [Saprospiraceae bacterium]